MPYRVNIGWRVFVLLHVLRVAWHQHAHEIACVPEAFLAGDDDLFDVLAVEIADRALGERAFLVDEFGRGRVEREVANCLPQPQKIFEVAFDFRLGAAGAGGSQDHAHAFRHFQFLGDFLKSLRSSDEVILREMPPPRAVFGISTE